ncbi:hypothetical protein IMSHALPRED_001650 [Imshaugia aleurites]|uniref:SnoaL-like domain-containing protein n=1 Tax=Imshaugia aleurites TaxID=172621 RepID=A0A8H3J3B7_9LECA|nr:hypothetical protein IMSHALPRED_001650 [Imshaugia aleurites]
MPSQLPSLPNTITDPAIKAFIEKYYAVSNDPEVHDDYADLFTPGGEFSMNDKKAKGTQQIRDLRRAIWAHVPGRSHSPIQIYTHGDDETDLMILGDVSYSHHAGHETGADWAAKMKLEKQEGEVKVAYYHIIVVSSVLLFLSLMVGWEW